MEELDCNHTMNSVSQAVEWSYKEVKESWTVYDFNRRLLVREFLIGVVYTNSTQTASFSGTLRRFLEILGWWLARSLSNLH